MHRLPSSPDASGAARPSHAIPPRGALRVLALQALVDSSGSSRSAGDQYLVLHTPSLSSYSPSADELVLGTALPVPIAPGDALRLVAAAPFCDAHGVWRQAGDQWVVAQVRSHLPGPHEHVLGYERLATTAGDETPASPAAAAPPQTLSSPAAITQDDDDDDDDDAPRVPTVRPQCRWAPQFDEDYRRPRTLDECLPPEYREACAWFVGEALRHARTSAALRAVPELLGAAVALYTCAHPLGRSAALQMNAELRAEPDARRMRWRHLQHAAVAGLRMLPLYAGAAYAALPELLREEEYCRGSAHVWPAFTGLRRWPRAAPGAAAAGLPAGFSEARTVLCVELSDGRVVGGASLAPSEDELLVEPNTELVVRSYQLFTAPDPPHSPVGCLVVMAETERTRPLVPLHCREVSADAGAPRAWAGILRALVASEKAFCQRLQDAEYCITVCQVHRDPDVVLLSHAAALIRELHGPLLEALCRLAAGAAGSCSSPGAVLLKFSAEFRARYKEYVPLYAERIARTRASLEQVAAISAVFKVPDDLRKLDALSLLSEPFDRISCYCDALRRLVNVNEQSSDDTAVSALCVFAELQMDVKNALHEVRKREKDELLGRFRRLPESALSPKSDFTGQLPVDVRGKKHSWSPSWWWTFGERQWSAWSDIADPSPPACLRYALVVTGVAGRRGQFPVVSVHDLFGAMVKRKGMLEEGKEVFELVTKTGAIQARTDGLSLAKLEGAIEEAQESTQIRSMIDSESLMRSTEHYRSQLVARLVQRQKEFYTFARMASEVWRELQKAVCNDQVVRSLVEIRELCHYLCQVHAKIAKDLECIPPVEALRSVVSILQFWYARLVDVAQGPLRVFEQEMKCQDFAACFAKVRAVWPRLGSRSGEPREVFVSAYDTIAQMLFTMKIFLGIARPEDEEYPELRAVVKDLAELAETLQSTLGVLHVKA
eukprot:m51a1_g2936 hypothetical protein (946) ;mRNA; r:587441-590601